MRGMDETYGMGAGASVRKGKTAKQVRRARKAIDAKKTNKVQPASKTSRKESNLQLKRVISNVSKFAKPVSAAEKQQMMQKQRSYMRKQKP